MTAVKIKVATVQSRNFDIFGPIDPKKSKYHLRNENWMYVKKLKCLTNILNVGSVVWAYAWDDRPDNWEEDKPIEYELKLSIDRIVAYINEDIWSPFVTNPNSSEDGFEVIVRSAISTAPLANCNSSILVEAPLMPSEVMYRREFRNRHGKREIIKEINLI